MYEFLWILSATRKMYVHTWLSMHCMHKLPFSYHINMCMARPTGLQIAFLHMHIYGATTTMRKMNDNGMVRRKILRPKCHHRPVVGRSFSQFSLVRSHKTRIPMNYYFRWVFCTIFSLNLSFSLWPFIIAVCMQIACAYGLLWAIILYSLLYMAAAKWRKSIWCTTVQQHNVIQYPHDQRDPRSLIIRYYDTTEHTHTQRHSKESGKAAWITQVFNLSLTIWAKKK